MAANPTCKAPAGPVIRPRSGSTHVRLRQPRPIRTVTQAGIRFWGRGYGPFDISLLRRFALPIDRLTLTVEAESFNLFNKPNFDLPQAFTDYPTSGQISSANQRGQNPRQLQLAARLSF